MKTTKKLHKSINHELFLRNVVLLYTNVHDTSNNGETEPCFRKGSLISF